MIRSSSVVRRGWTEEVVCAPPTSPGGTMPS
jgi:hypothetical protein